MGARDVKTGDRFGDWVACGPAYRRPANSPFWKYYLPCLCTACGETKRNVQFDTLTSGKSTRCGCKRDRPQRDYAPVGDAHYNYRHGLSRTVAHTAWTNMRTRSAQRGISLCARWDSFERFYSDMGPRPPGARFKRLDKRKGFTPTNCYWAPTRRRPQKMGMTWTAKKKTRARS